MQSNDYLIIQMIKSFCLHNICVYSVYLLCIYKDTDIQHIFLDLFTWIYLYSYNVYIDLFVFIYLFNI